MTGLAPVQAPAWQVSVWVQALPSEQALPLGLAGFEQAPVLGSQVPAAWHWSEARHTTALAPVQAPFWQVSMRVQASPSEQAVPSGRGGLEQTPVVGSQVPAAWHWSEAVQPTGSAPTQLPAWQLSCRVQALPSEQPVPSGLGGSEQRPVAGLQTPAS